MLISIQMNSQTNLPPVTEVIFTYCQTKMKFYKKKVFTAIIKSV